MKIKLSQIMEAQEPLKRLAAEKYPANIAYRIQRNIRVLAPEARTYEKAREDLIRNKYGVAVENEGGPVGSYRVPPEKIPDFTAEIALLLEEEVDLDIRTLSLESIHDITPMDMLALEWMFDAPAEGPDQPDTIHRPRARRSGNGYRVSQQLSTDAQDIERK